MVDWERLGKIVNAWVLAIDGKHALYVEERRDSWYIHFSVSRSEGLMLASKAVQERMSADELNAGDDPVTVGRQLAAKMQREFE